MVNTVLNFEFGHPLIVIMPSLNQYAANRFNATQICLNPLVGVICFGAPGSSSTGLRRAIQTSIRSRVVVTPFAGSRDLVVSYSTIFQT
jgi:hypothetical protein